MAIDQKLNTDRITPEIINYIVNKIVNEIDPEKIILFGSFAKGDQRKDSDLDLFIIKDSKESSQKMRRKVDRLLWGCKFSVDLIVRSTSEVEWNLKAKNSFYTNHIFKESEILYVKN